MIAQNRDAIGQLKIVLFGLAVVFAVSATFLLWLFSSAATVIGTSPDEAISLPHGTSTGILMPGERRWFIFSPNQNNNRIQDMNLNAIFTADSGASLQNANFELFSAGEVIAWQQGKEHLNNFGAGMPVAATEAPGLGERIWRGNLLSNDVYYLTLENGTETVVDYWLFDTAAPERPMPPQPAIEAAAPVVEPAPVDLPGGSSPEAALPLKADRQLGALEPGQDVWFSFNIDDLPGEVFEPLALTLVVTPNDGGQADRVPLYIHTSAAVANWSHDNRDNFEHVGVASVARRDDNPWTGEKVWSGWIVSGDTYFVRIVNGSGSRVDYWLFKGDIYYPQLGG